MAQDIRYANSTRFVDGEWTKRRISSSSSKFKEHGTETRSEGSVSLPKRHSGSILTALGDEYSRRILLSSIASGKTVEQISADQRLPLSTCYRRIRELVDEGLMVLEKIVITPIGKRYAVYRTSFSDATIRLNAGEVAVETTPNADIRDKLLSRWMTTNYPTQNQRDVDYPKAEA